MVLDKITGLFRNLAMDKFVFKKFIQYDILDRFCMVCEKFQKGDILVNTIKTLSKLSVFKDCCMKIFKYK